MSMTTLITLCLMTVTFDLSHGTESEQVEAFIEDTIEAWQLRSPTIIVNDDIPTMCITYQWLLCLSNNHHGGELLNHLASIHHHGKQDGLIFVGSQGHEKLLQQLPESGSTISKSNYHVFMPLTYQNEIKLRLDSNIIFYRSIDIASFELYDVFAVKGGPPIKLNFGKWTFGNGFIFKMSMNRWERRTDLQGTIFINCLVHSPPESEFRKDENGSIMGSKGLFQDYLFYITDRLNVSIKTVEAEWEASLINGSWNGPIGFLQRHEADVVTAKLGINLQRSAFIDFPIKIEFWKLSLCAIRSTKGTSPNMWVYVNVFGFHQWMIFIALLILIVMVLIAIHALSEDPSGREFGTKRGSNKKHRLNSASSALAMVFLYTMQMGSHTNSKQLATRLLTLSMSILTLLLFSYYATDITAEMTSGSPEIPIKTFKDVIYHNYKVITTSPYYVRLLSRSEPGSAKREVHDNHLEMIKDYDDVAHDMIRNSRILWYGPVEMLNRQISTDAHKAFALKMDDAVYSHGGFGLQKDSEFCALFNNYILKGLETGVIVGFKQSRYKDNPEENFEMMEPQPLGLNNVMFCFISLGIGICVSIINVMIELIIRKTSN